MENEKWGLDHDTNQPETAIFPLLIRDLIASKKPGKPPKRHNISARILGQRPTMLQAIQHRRTSMVRRNQSETTSEPHKQIITKAIRTFQGSRHNLPSCISNRTPTTMENLQHFPCIAPYSIQGNRTTWAKLRRTTTRHHRRRTRMGSQTNSSSQTLQVHQEASVPHQMKGLLTLTRLLGKRHRHTCT